MALLYAHETTYPSVLNSDGRIKVQGLNLSFTDILRGTDGLAGLPPQDLVYSVGLLDYLTDHRAKALVKRLYDLLMPGGLLIIGNMNECPLSNYWPMEYITDWTLQYRNDADMVAWADGLNAPRLGPRPSGRAASGCCSCASTEADVRVRRPSAGA
ncbi:MAG: class I SAM-dependent methyltransferase [Rhizomicrobium sp.]